MNAKEVILNRRSCRKYLPKDVPKEVIEDILLAGRSAPTGSNRQKLRFNVIMNNVKLLNEIGTKCYEKFEKKEWFEQMKKDLKINDPIFWDAPCAIIITALREESQQYPQRFFMDAGIATAQIILMAGFHGLSSVPIGVAKMANEEAVLNGIGVSKESEELLLCIPFGYEDPEWKNFITKKELTSHVNWVK